MNNETLLILIPGFPKDEADSTCVPFPQAFIRNLKRHDPSRNIVVIAFQYPFIKSIYEWHGVQVHAFGGKNKGGLSRLMLWRKISRRIKTIIEENNVIGILNFWLGECALVSKHVARKYDIRSLTWMMGQDAKKENTYFKRIKPTGESLIALSDFVAGEFFKNYGFRPAHTIPLAIDSTLFSSEQRERSIDVLGAGSLIALKQYDRFIKIIASLSRAHPEIKTMICGDGPQLNSLQQLIDELQMNRHIKLAGEVAHSEVLRLMQSSKVFLHTSSYEGFGGVCSEALFAGAHVVSYCQPMNTVFDHTYIVATEAEMERKVSELLMKKELDHQSINTYSMKEVCARVMSLYK